MKTGSDLRQEITAMDHRGYPAYKSLAGGWRFETYILNIDHVQGDPFAAPSRLSVKIDGRTAGFPAELYATKERKTALEDLLIRRFHSGAERASFKAKGSGKSGLIGSSRPGQEILERTACRVDEKNGSVLFRFEVGFPANGRSIAARELIRILFDFLPDIIKSALFYQRSEAARYRAVSDLADDQAAIRTELKSRGLVAFIGNGSVLPRESGISQRPMRQAVKFESPKSMEVTLSLPHAGELTGMAIPHGVTLIVGGGYHGKSTLLEALERGVYNHIAGDGREYVVTDATAVKLRAEDGRSIRGDDISMFIDNLPGGADCRTFSTENASGSTSQAANTIEAMEAGSRAFLIDEDTCATNFMIRDELMARVVKREDEPITPFLERIRPLYEQEGISTVLVAGSSGLYFETADRVIQMDRYRPIDITERAKAAAAEYAVASGRDAAAGTPAASEAAAHVTSAAGSNTASEASASASSAPGSSTATPHAGGLAMPDFGRIPEPGRFDRAKIKVTGIDEFLIDHDSVFLGQVEQLVDREQTAALAHCLVYLEESLFDGRKTLREAVAELCGRIEKDGLAAVMPGARALPDFGMPRQQEIFACVNRYRKLRLKK